MASRACSGLSAPPRKQCSRNPGVDQTGRRPALLRLAHCIASEPAGRLLSQAQWRFTWTLSDVDEAWPGEIAERQPALYAIIDAAGLAHGKGMKSYLSIMAVRLLEMRHLLKPTGSHT